MPGQVIELLLWPVILAGVILIAVAVMAAMVVSVAWEIVRGK